jgi:hypothetical protein
MKNVLFSLLALFILSAAPAAAHTTANDEPLIVRSKVMEGGLEVLIANLEQTKTTLTLTNLDTNREMFSDRVRNHNGYSYNLNLDELKPGRYLLSVTKGKEVRQQVLLLTKKGIMCSAWK